MDRRRAAGALIALAACLATSHAAPTATSNHTALDLYDEVSEGCYYNFQHYGEGDRIMTNEPCLNCTCHNRMLMCYLRVCPFTKAIGQDCTVEKRADQCCPIVTCPDVPVDLLTSTSTSSPAEYGGTGVGKIDKYGCTINGKYFPEGAKVPPTPNKPCEHCYCIRNMTTCVMQECTLHVDGCTPIYHKDVCCPVRYFCDHPEDEMLLLDDMTTTIRPTPGFLLTTIAPMETTEAPETTTLPARRDCTEGDQLYPDGALIKTDKPCQHCYCMKGDIVCVVQECGTPMENEGKNCTSLPPREGQCCPDTYICEGDESSSEPSTALPFEEIVTTTIAPPRRVSVEGSGYRNEDEIRYTEAPTFATELEGSGEEYLSEKPIKPASEVEKVDDFGPVGESEFIPQTTSMRDESEEATTEPDKGLNTVPSEEDESVKPMGQEQSTSRSEIPITEHTRRMSYETTPSVIAVKEQESSGLTSAVEMSTSKYEVKETEPSIMEEPTTARSDTTEQSSEPTVKESAPQEEPKATESYQTTERDTHKPEDMTETSIGESPTATEISQSIEQSTDVEKESWTEKPQASTESSIVTVLPIGEVQATTQRIETDEETTQNIRRTMPPGEDTSKGIEEEKTESTSIEPTTEHEKLGITEQASEQNTIPTGADAQESSEPTILEETTSKHEHQPTASPTLVEQPAESTEGTIAEKTTSFMDFGTTEAPITEANEPELEPATVEDKIPLITTESVSEEQRTTTSVPDAFTKTSQEDKIPVTGLPTSVFVEQKSTEKSSLEPDVEKTTIEPIMELSTFAYLHTLEPEFETDTVATEKVEIPVTTTVNEADNEIPPPGRIPGEGDCLLEGVTYKNDSVVPSTNKCHTGCKCVSSIIKCDPIICSSPPEGMDNCQPRYDSPETCCPTYICDHGMETIPPQPQSHITGTESPTSYPAVECTGDQCNVSEDKKESTVPSGTIDQAGPSECDNEGCKLPVEIPGEGCTDSKCELPQSPPKESQLHHTMEVIQETPVKEVIQSCDNPENCKETNVPAPCEGASCPTGVQGELCDKERGCAVEPEIPPPKTISELCGSDGECKPVSIPEPSVPPCEGESCSNGNEDCSAGQCLSVSLPPQPSQQEEICSGGKSCETPLQPDCDNDKCVDKDLENKFGCTGDECVQREPLLPTQETSFNVPSEPGKGKTTTSSMFEEVTTIKSKTDVPKQEPIESDMPELPAQGVTEVSIEKEPKLPESSVTDIAEEETTPPYRETELASTAIETMPQDKTEGYLLEKETERPNLPAESHPAAEAVEGLPTELPIPDIETSQPTTLYETKQSEEVTNTPDMIVSEVESTTAALPESEKPEQHAEPTSEVPSAVTEITTPSKSVSEEIITEASVIPESESQKPIHEDHKEVEQVSTESPEAVQPESSTPALKTTPQPQETEGPILPESASTVPAKETQVPEIDMQTPLETKGTEPPYSLVTNQAEETTPSITEFVKITTETSVTEEEQEPERRKPYTPQQTTEAVAPIASDTKPPIFTSSQEAFTEKAGDAEPEKAPTTEKQKVQPEHPEPSTTELFEDTQSGFGSQTTSSIIEEAEVSSGKPNIIETVSPTEEIELETEEPGIMLSVKPEEEQNTPVTEAEPTSNEKATEKPEQVSTKAQEEFVTQDVTKSPISDETVQPGDLSSEQLSTHEPQKSSTESTINEEFETKQPEIQPEIEPTDEVKTDTETSTEPNEKGSSPESVTDLHMEYSHTKEPLAATTELTREPVSSAPIYTTEANTEPSVNEEKDTDEQQTESVPPHLLEQPVETPKPELEEEQEVPTQTSRPTDKEEQSLQTTTPGQQEGPTQTMRPEVTQEEFVPTSRPESEQEESAQTSIPEGVQEKPAQTLRPAVEEEEPTQTLRPESEKEESAQTSSPESVQEVPEQTSRPETDQGEPVQTPRPEGEQEESTHTLRPVVPGEPAQTSRPESEQEEPMLTSRPKDELEEPAQTSRPEIEQEGPIQTSRPESEYEESAQTLRPEDEQEEPVQTTKPDLGQEEPGQTSRPEGEQEEPAETSKPDIGQDEPAQTSKPEGEHKESAATSKPEIEPEESTQTYKPALGEKPAQTSRPEIEEHEYAQTQKPEGEQDKPTQTSRPDIEQEEPAQTSRPEIEQEVYAQTLKPEGERDEPDKTSRPGVEQEESAQTSRPESGQEEPTQTSKPEGEQETAEPTSKPESEQEEHIQPSTAKPELVPEESAQTLRPEIDQSETTPYLVELEEHTHKMDEEPTMQTSEEPTTLHIQPVAPEQVPTESIPSEKETDTERPYEHKEEESVPTEEPRITTAIQEEPETSSEPSLVDKFGSEEDKKEALGATPTQTAEQEVSTYRPSTQTEKTDTEKPISADELTTQSGQDVTSKPISVPIETTAPEEEFIPVTSKATTPKVDEEAPSQPPMAKPGEKPSEVPSSTAIPETSKPEEVPPVDEDFPPSGGYNQEPEPDYTDEDQAFGPGTCRYGGKVYVSAQQIPRDDPCDFCFCFRSDIICLQQSCPPPIHGCHEEPIQGFCCPRYECPVSMATTLNVTTTTTTTTTTLPPHFLPHAYKGAAQRKGCQIKGHTYQVGEVVRASTGPCLHCTCGGDGQMKCDPKACTPEPMLRQMIAAAVSAKRRR